MGFSDKEPQGFLTKGFTEPHMMVTNHSFPFMVDFISEKGYRPYVELCQYEVPLNKELPIKYEKFADRVIRQLDIQVLEFKSTKQIKQYVKPIFNLINKTSRTVY